MFLRPGFLLDAFKWRGSSSDFARIYDLGTRIYDLGKSMFWGLRAGSDDVEEAMAVRKRNRGVVAMRIFIDWLLPIASEFRFNAGMQGSSMCPWKPNFD